MVSVKHLDAKKEVVAACLKLVEWGYFVGTYGNVSARVEGGLIITPSRVDYQVLTPEDMVTVSDRGSVIDGTRLPSSELEVHRQIYLSRSDINAVVHSHSIYATALSCLHDTIPVIIEEQSQVIGDEIRCTRYVPAGQHRALGVEVAQKLGESNAVLIANHGTVSCGRTLKEALFICQIVERIAQIRLLTKTCGAVVPIPQEYVESERYRFLYKYGTKEDGAAVAIEE